MGRLEGKVAFITGSGSGIARAAARLFAVEGACVAIAELKPELGRACEATVLDSGGYAVFVWRAKRSRVPSLSLLGNRIHEQLAGSSVEEIEA
jgi:NAD(P)-dependent dehydrogenase (short-subunit alcohol dehydrogenase family)